MCISIISQIIKKIAIKKGNFNKYLNKVRKFTSSQHKRRFFSLSSKGQKLIWICNFKRLAPDLASAQPYPTYKAKPRRWSRGRGCRSSIGVSDPRPPAWSSPPPRTGTVTRTCMSAFGQPGYLHCVSQIKGRICEIFLMIELWIYMGK